MMRAICVDADGMLSACEVDGATLTTVLDGINDLLGSEWYDVVGDTIAVGVDVFVDDEGACLRPDGSPRQPLNATVSVMLHRSGRPGLFHGPALFLGHTVDGDPAGLTREQVVTIVTAWFAANRHTTVPSVAALLAH